MVHGIEMYVGDRLAHCAWVADIYLMLDGLSHVRPLFDKQGIMMLQLLPKSIMGGVAAKSGLDMECAAA